MESFYKIIGTSRQAVSQMNKIELKQNKSKENIIEIVKHWRLIHPKMGSRQLFYTIENIGGIDLGIGVSMFEQLMSAEKLTVGKTSKKWIKTSDGMGKEKYPNLINGITLSNVNQLIVGDITYYHLDDQMSYIFSLKDVYSQRILGLIPSLNMEAANAISCLNDALAQRKGYNMNGCIHHTDNGSQYNALLYKKRLMDVGIRISRANNCLENGSSENLNGLVKNSYLEPWSIKSYQQLVDACKELIYINNEQRAIKQLGNMSPTLFEKIITGLQPHERPIKMLHDFDS